MRRALLSVLIVCAAAFTPADAQVVATQAGTSNSPFTKDYKVDFAIPDAPAFKLLEVNQSAILRPQTVKALAVAVSGFRGQNNTFVVPREFAVEASPALLIGGRLLPVATYNQKKALYATRVSGATRRDSAGRSQLALGLRYSLVDEQDLRTDTAFVSDQQVTPLTRRMVDVYRAARRRIGPLDDQGNPLPIVLNEEEQKQIDSLNTEIKRIFAARYWNAKSAEVAFGARASTLDSLARDPKFDELAAWATYAHPLAKMGQLLLGVKLGSARDTTNAWERSNAIAGRLYIGSNEAKLFGEAQQAISPGRVTADWLLNGGVEFRIPRVGWITASGGVESGRDGSRPRALTAFAFKSEIPGLP
jgi:hypothetical protein